MVKNMTVEELRSILDRIDALMSECRDGTLGQGETLARSLGLIDYYRARVYGTPLFGAE